MGKETYVLEASKEHTENTETKLVGCLTVLIVLAIGTIGYSLGGREVSNPFSLVLFTLSVICLILGFYLMHLNNVHKNYVVIKQEERE